MNEIRRSNIQNSPNIIQSDPETRTKASMSFSLSQLSRCRSGSKLQHRLQQVAIWEIKEGGDKISEADHSGGSERGGGGGGGNVQLVLLCSFRLKKRNVFNEETPRRPIAASFLCVDFPPSPSWQLRNGRYHG